MKVGNIYTNYNYSIQTFISNYPIQKTGDILKQVTGYVSDVYGELIEEMAHKRGSSKSNIVKKAIEGYFDEHYEEKVKELEKE